MWKWLTVVACVITTGAALADEGKRDGNELIQLCRLVPATGKFVRGDAQKAFESAEDLGRCRGLISGFLEEMNFRGNTCVPGGVPHVQAWRVVKKFLDDNPTLLHKPQSTLIRTALVAAWPCK